jgi:hypothetical protein
LPPVPGGAGGHHDGTTLQVEPAEAGAAANELITAIAMIAHIRFRTVMFLMLLAFLPMICKQWAIRSKLLIYIILGLRVGKCQKGRCKVFRRATVW